MERAGAAVAREALAAYRAARRCGGLRRRLERRRRPRCGTVDPGGRLRCRGDAGPRWCGRRDRRALRHRLPRRAAAGGGGRDRADQRSRRTGGRGRPAVGRERLDRRDRGRRRAGRSDGDVPRGQGRAVVAPGRLHAGRVVVADIGLESVETSVGGPPSPRSSISSRVEGSSDTKYTAGSEFIVGGSPGMTGAAVLAATAVLRADAGYVTLPFRSLAAHRGGADARAGQARVGGRRRGGHDP